MSRAQIEIITSTCRVSVHVCVALHFATRIHGSQLLVTYPRIPAKFAGNSRVTNVNGALSTSIHGHRGGDHEHLWYMYSKNKLKNKYCMYRMHDDDLEARCSSRDTIDV